MGINVPLDSRALENAYLKATEQDARITKAVLHANDIDQQTDYALDEIQAILAEYIIGE